MSSPSQPSYFDVSRVEQRVLALPNPTTARWLRLFIPALVAALSLFWLCVALKSPLEFDDAYMFYRYALNIRHGYGIAWNPGGVPTYGMTSQLWVWFVLPFTLLPTSPAAALQLASWLTGISALGMTTFAVMARSERASPGSAAVVLGCVAIPLLVNPIFAYHMTTGMDTMLSMLANAAFAFAVLRYGETRSGPLTPHLVGLLGFAAFLARPENALCALVAPLLVWTTRPGVRAWRDLFGIAALPLILMAMDLIACRWVFGVALPLSFYAKSMHGYAGFQNRENAVDYLFCGLGCATPFLAVLCAAPARRRMPRIAAFLLPVAATFLYLLTVRQVMGFQGRYFVPFLPFVIVAAALAFDGAPQRDPRVLRLRISLAALVLLALCFGIGLVRQRAQAAYLGLILSKPVPAPALSIAASEPLPVVGWFAAIRHLSDDVVARLPAGARIAASEVGYLGAASPNAEIIDIVGLNDTRIGARGFSMDDLLDRAPDLIWLPHWDYTGLRGMMLSDARLFERYRVIAGAFNYGIAIRIDSPLRSQIETAVRVAGSRLYAAQNLEAYVVRSPTPRDGLEPR
jgi:hypothetical protein